MEKPHTLGTESAPSGLPSTRKLMMAVAGSLFAAVLVCQHFLPHSSYFSSPISVLIESSLSVALAFSLIYLTAYRPMIRALIQRQDSENRLLNHSLMMEEKLKSSLARLAHSEAEQRAVLQSSPDVIMRIDLAGTIQSANKAAYRIFGYSEKELVGQNLSFLLPSEIPRILVDGYISSLDVWSGDVSQHTSEAKVTARNGRQIPIELTISECVIESNFYYVIVLRDISERKKSEMALKERKALKEREELYSQMFRNNQAVKLLVDPESGLIVDANNAACKFYGYSAEKMAKKKLWDIDTLPRKELLKRMNEAKSGNAGDIHFTHKLSSGEIRQVEVHSSSIVVRGKQMLFSIVHDVTDRKLAEKKLKKHTSNMEKALNRADDVLQSLLKPTKPVPYFITSPLYKVSHTIGGGDSLRWIDFSENYAGLYLHDVSGHGIQETLLNILATAAVDSHKLNLGFKTVASPSVFLDAMNSHMMGFCAKTEHYITAVYMLMDFEKREIKFSLAGHPAPWLISPVTPAKRVGASNSGMMLGIFDLSLDIDCGYVDTTVKLQPGETFFIYSDGLMEQLNSNSVPFEVKFQDEILPRLAGLDPNEAHHLLEKLFDEHLDGKKPDDDVSFVFIGTRPENSYETSEFTLTNSLASSLRERIEMVKAANGLEDSYIRTSQKREQEVQSLEKVNNVSEVYAPIIDKLQKENWADKRIDEVRLAMGEILLNAMMHGNLCSVKQIVKLSHILHQDMLEVCVADEGSGLEGHKLSQVMGEQEIMMESGRGLHLVRKYADEIYFNNSGNEIWALFSKSADKQKQAATQSNTIISTLNVNMDSPGDPLKGRT